MAGGTTNLYILGGVLAACCLVAFVGTSLMGVKPDSPAAAYLKGSSSTTTTTELPSDPYAYSGVATSDLNAHLESSTTFTTFTVTMTGQSTPGTITRTVTTSAPLEAERHNPAWELHNHRENWASGTSESSIAASGTSESSIAALVGEDKQGAILTERPKEWHVPNPPGSAPTPPAPPPPARLPQTSTTSRALALEAAAETTTSELEEAWETTTSTAVFVKMAVGIREDDPVDDPSVLIPQAAEPSDVMR